MKIREVKYLIVFLLAIAIINFASADDTSSYKYIGSFGTPTAGSFFNTASQPQFYASSFNQYYSSAQIKTYWPIFSDPKACQSRQDFLVQILPAGCSPAVVRSDLLAEQDVPVFCQLSAIKINPVIDVSSIDSISFKGNYPKEVGGISFHPARAAIRTSGSQLLGSPVINNIGYVVILLKRNEFEANLTETVKGNLTATIQYDLKNAFGVGRAEFILKQLDEVEWQRTYKEYGFWKGKGYLRLERLDGDKAEIGIYRDVSTKISSVTLEKGKTSNDIYLPSTYCQAALNIRLNSVDAPKLNIKLSVSGKEEQSLVLYKDSSFLDGKCKVSSITKAGVGGTAKINCYGKNYELKIGVNNKFNFSVDESESIQDLFSQVGDYTFAYYGKADLKIAENIDSEYAVLVKPRNAILTEKDKTDMQNTIASAVQSAANQEYSGDKIDGFKKKIVELLINNDKIAKSTINTNKSVIVIFNSKTQLDEDISFGTDKKKVKFLGAVIKETIYSASSGIDAYFNNASENYKKLVNLYPSEKSNTDEVYGQTGISRAIKLADDLSKGKEELEFIDLAKNTYPGTKIADDASQKEAVLKYSGEESVAGVYIGTDFYLIKLEDVRLPATEDASAYAVLRGIGKDGSQDKDIEGRFAIDDYIYPETSKNYSNNKAQCIEYVKVNWLEEDKAMINYRAVTYSGRDNSAENCASSNVSVKLETWTQLGRFNINIKQIDLNKVALVSLNPKIVNSRSEVNFSFNIGIEKRAIQLAPEKTKERIKNLNESIKKWEDINLRLGNVVSGLKGACLATSAYLVAKNLVTDFVGGSGEALARNKVMRSSGGWVDQCRDEIRDNPNKYKGVLGGEPSLDRCFSQNADKINADVSAMQKIMETQNEQLKGTWKNAQSNKGLLDDLTKENTIDSKKAALEYLKLHPELEGVGGATNSDLTQMINSGEVRIDELRDIVTAKQQMSSGSGVLLSIGNKTINDKTAYVQDRAKARQAQTDFENSMKTVFGTQLNNRNTQVLEPLGTNKPFVSPITLTSQQASDLNAKPGLENVFTSGDASKKKPADKVILYTVPGSAWGKDSGEHETKKVIVKLKQQGSDYYPEKAYDEETGADLTESFNRALGEAKIGGFKEASPGLCKNDYSNPEVRFYESGQNKGLPAIVPIDTANGWYAATKQTTGVFGNVKAFEESGKLSSFWLCNVGENKREEFESGGRDDICTMINLQTGQPTNEIGCVSKDEAAKLVSAAIKAVYSAAEQYGKPEVTIVDVRGAGRSYRVGKPAVNTPSSQCQDFMSPNDCALLFNVCDPVICPSSRCDFGGTFPVDDVIQSGIIGSIALCLPNFGNPFNGGVAIPICLSGLHAGIESWVSILRGHRDCLQANLDSGKMMGICDEIYSIYTCEFFWKQVAPFIKALLPKLVALAYGQGTRGGGEYATVTAAWDNAEKSINYMTQVYGPNAYKAFQTRSLADAGTEVCKGFIGTKFPNNWKAFTEPDSPVQFTAYFSEETFTEATVPATSQYKVFYHISAGKDQGVSYQIYLKDPPKTSYYNQNPYVQVDSGFIAKGEYLDKTPDFTAPSGYKQLCVNINAQEYCGFKQVSSSFAINYAKDLYMKDAAADRVDNEADCISGKSSAYSLLQPNLQAGADEVVNPAIYNRGIIRVCSNIDPAYSTDATQQVSKRRWQDMGWCDEANKVKCWVDTESVKDVIHDKKLENDTLSQINKNMKESLLKSEEIMDPGKTEEKLKSISNSQQGMMKAFLADVENTENIEDLNQKYISAASGLFNNYTNPILKTATIDYSALFANLEEVIQKGFYNSQRAEALLYEASLYDALARKAKEFVISGTKSNTAAAGTTTGTGAFSLSGNNIMFNRNLIGIIVPVGTTGLSFYIKDKNNVYIVANIDKKSGVISPVQSAEAEIVNLASNYLYQNGQLVLLKGATAIEEIYEGDLGAEGEDRIPAEYGSEGTSSEKLSSTIVNAVDCPIENLIFTFHDGCSTTGMIYYKFDSSWKYSFDRTTWWDLSYIASGILDTNKNFNVLMNKKPNDKISGTTLLIQRTLNNNENCVGILNWGLGNTKLETDFTTLNYQGNYDSKKSDDTYVYTSNWMINNAFISSSSKLYNKQNFEGACLIFSGGFS